MKKQTSSVSNPTFEQSMLTSWNFSMAKLNNSTDWQLFKKLYENNYYEKHATLSQPTIPKIIHQIWLGSPLPAKYLALSNTWRKKHPDWQYKLWTDENIKNLQFKNHNLFKAVSNPGAKSDILRYALLDKYGGLYIDTDFECLKSFDELHQACTFYSGLTYDAEPTLANGLIGAAPGHAVIKLCINKLDTVKTVRSVEEIMNITGPYFLTQTFIELAKKNPNGLVPFPVTFFYPFPSNQRSEIDQNVIRSYIKPESFCLHYWQASWVPKSNFFDKLKDISQRYRRKVHNG